MLLINMCVNGSKSLKPVKIANPGRLYMFKLNKLFKNRML